MAKKSAKNAAKRTAAPADDYTKQKLAVRGQCRIGSTMTYSGPNKAFGGKKVKVVGHEGRGGIFIELGDKKLTCSPFALLGKKPDTPKPTGKAKGTAKAAKSPAPKATKRKAGATPAPSKKSPQSPKVAPTQAPAAPAEPTPASAKPQAKARKAA